MSKSKIEWTGSTWNPVTGCNKISEGCDNCYAERMAKRLKAMGQRNYMKLGSNLDRLSENTKSENLGVDMKGLMTRKSAQIPILGQPVKV